MKIEFPTTRQYILYEYLKEHCVGKENKQPRLKIAETINQIIREKNLNADYYSLKGDGVQQDIREIRKTISPLGKFVSSDVGGYFIPRNETERTNFLKNRTIGHIYTALSDGSLTKKELYKIINEIDVNIPLDKQMKFQFGKYEKDIVTHYGSDKEDEFRTMTLEQIKQLYYDLGGYPVVLTRNQYIERIKVLRDE